MKIWYGSTRSGESGVVKILVEIYVSVKTIRIRVRISGHSSMEDSVKWYNVRFRAARIWSFEV